MLRVQWIRAWVGLLGGIVVLAWAEGGGAHPLAPVLLEIREESGDQTWFLWRTSRRMARGTRVEPIIEPGCEGGREARVEAVGSAVERRWRGDCRPGGLVGRRIAIEGLGGAGLDAMVRIELADGRRISQMLRAEDDSFVVPEGQSTGEVFVDYAELGTLHILGGIDHLLFVFGLMLLVSGLGPLVRTITAFTLGHSVTLCLAALELTRLPPGPIEVLIALSILMLASELARPGDVPPSALGRRPWLMGAGFGLLHGMGFAGALREVGLPSVEIPVALLSFNLGIEVGQLAFVGAILALMHIARAPLAKAPAWAKRAPAYGLGIAAGYWVWERSAALL